VCPLCTSGQPWTRAHCREAVAALERDKQKAPQDWFHHVLSERPSEIQGHSRTATHCLNYQLADCLAAASSHAGQPASIQRPAAHTSNTTAFIGVDRVSYVTGLFVRLVSDVVDFCEGVSILR